MIFLTSADSIQVVTSTAATLHSYAAYIDARIADGFNMGLGKQTQTIAAATTTTILDAPASGNVRNCPFLTLRNAHASLSNTLTILVGTELYGVTLASGDTLQFNALGFVVVPYNPISSGLVDAKGDLLVGTANNVVARKAVGTQEGHALHVDAGQPDGMVWKYPALHRLTGSVLTSAAAYIAFTNLNDPAYAADESNLVVTFDMRPVTDDVYAYIYLATGAYGSPTWHTTAGSYAYGGAFVGPSGTPVGWGSATDGLVSSLIALTKPAATYGIRNLSNAHISGVLHFVKPFRASLLRAVFWDVVATTQSDAVTRRHWGGGYAGTSTTFNGFQMGFSSGNVAAGSAQVYGYRGA